jgi:hypothetical protein
MRGHEGNLYTLVSNWTAVTPGMAASLLIWEDMNETYLTMRGQERTYLTIREQERNLPDNERTGGKHFFF